MNESESERSSNRESEGKHKTDAFDNLSVSANFFSLLFIVRGVEYTSNTSHKIKADYPRCICIWNICFDIL